MRKFIGLFGSLFILGFLVQACGPKFKTQPDCGFQKNVYGERISWKDRLPIRLQIHNSFPSEYISALEKAVKTWEENAGKKLFEIEATNVVTPLNPRQDSVNMVYWLDTWETEKTSEQARTTVYYVGNEIRESDIRVNASNYNYYIESPSESLDLHLESLLLHELGHVLGLTHRADNGTVMATTLAGSTVRNTVTETDKNSLICEY